MKLLIPTLLVILAILEYKASDLPRCTTVRGTVRTCDVFSETYQQAQGRFQNVAASYCDVQSIEIVPGYDMDVCLIRGNRPGVVVHVSGTHGIEGFAGSAIQNGFLADGLPEQYPTLLFVHAFNPFGMAHFRRFNENNVDLNRNGLTPEEWSSFVSPHWNKQTYDSFYDLFYLSQPVGFWKTKVLSWLKTGYYVAKLGIPKLKEAMVGGQYHDPSGIFYGGTTTQPSLVELRKYIETLDIFEEDTVAVTWIDVHTGLGPSGIDTFLPGVVAPVDQDEIRHYFPDIIFGANDTVTKQVNQGYEKVKGLTIDYFYQSFLDKDAKHLFFTQEFGTVPEALVGNSMIVENAAYHDDSLTFAQKQKWAKSTTMNTFFPHSEAWRVRVLERGIRRIYQAMQRSMDKSTMTDSEFESPRTTAPATNAEKIDRSEL